MTDTIRIGIVGLGGNCRLRHVPGFRACRDVEIVAVANRRRSSTEEAAREYGIPRTYEHWQDLVTDPEVNAVLIGAWPILHAPVTLAALAAGKHVLTEARMAMNAAEARQMLAESRRHPELVCQVVPSPFGLRAHHMVEELLEQGFIGQLREAVVIGHSDALVDPATPLSWRQVGELSGLNMLSLGILHETLARWIDDPVRVYAHAHAFVPQRLDAATGLKRRVGTPDSVHVLARLPYGAQVMYHLSGVTHFGAGSQIHLYGSEGTLKYKLLPEDRLWGARRGEAQLSEIVVPPEREYGWRVEAEFIDAIRGGPRSQFTDFEAGVRYMEFTEAVARSAAQGLPVDLPLEPPVADDAAR